MRRWVWLVLGFGACAGPAPEPPVLGSARAVLHRTERLPERVGALQLRCTPEDAEVFVDGSRVGRCEELRQRPLQLKNGMHRVDVKKDGFLPYSTWYDPNETEGTQQGFVRAALTIRLQPAQGNEVQGEAR